ncbi:protein arginine N-methyltransferase 7-like [Oppia nitens]|uniref:protein arginine N-methyltransferase 7-like n=1 Tax=Oppia nitens TaxID=1686743 RepID=UPI0023DC34E0|nr:protein arginine N-methyltransferase 7-like [Oppia nitens]
MRSKTLIRLMSTVNNNMITDTNNIQFVQKYNAMSGQFEWQKKSMQSFDYWQDLARSAFADMVNDGHRNQLYYKAIQKTVNQLKSCNKEILGLDIGTGTGLLSMMAIKSGAHRVVACDISEPIVKCAQNIIHKNGFSDQIKVINKHSSDLTIGTQTSDLHTKADLLVAELFDTELIGEGAIGVYRHAVQHLLSPEALLVPSRARIYCQLVESDKLFSYHQFSNEMKVNDDITIVSPQNIKSCAGTNVLHDIQINELKPNDDFIIVTEPEVVFEFNFNDITTLESNVSKTIEFKPICDINGSLVLFVWWDLDMDFDGEIVLSCGPYWTYKDNTVTAKNIPWRDHWMQSVYYLSADKKVYDIKINEIFKLNANRDEYSLWFSDYNEEDKSNKFCKCGVHMYLSRTRISMINDISRLKLYNQSIEEINNNLKTESTNALFIGDFSHLPIVATKHKKIKKVFCLARDQQTDDFITCYSKTNGCEDKIELIHDFDCIEDDSVGLVLGEPYFNKSDLPWNHLTFWHLIHNIPKNILTHDVVIMPNKAVIKAIPIEFDNLWKINAEVGDNVEGFDLSIYDQLIKEAKVMSDSSIESQSLWEYPGKAIAEKPYELFSFNFNQPIDSLNVAKAFVKFDISNHLPKLNTKYIAIVFWIDFYLTDKLVESSGPMEPIVCGKYVNWNRHYRQGVYFVPNIDYLNKDNLLAFIATIDKTETELVCHLSI